MFLYENLFHDEDMDDFPDEFRKMRLVHVHEDKLYITVIDSKCGCAVYSILQSLSDLIEDPKQNFWDKLIAENVMLF